MENFDRTKFGSVEKDVTYNKVDGKELLMDMYYPTSGGPWPGLVFVHGGGWMEGDKAPLAVVPTEAGFLVVSINYRMYPAYRFPAMIQDVKCAIRHLRANAAVYNLDPDRIALIGHSAGAHLVALAGLADESAGWDVGPYLDLSSRVQAVIEMSGPTDLTRPFPAWVEEVKSLVFGNEQLVVASPLNYVHKEAPPFLIVHGDADDAVPVEQAHLLYNALVQISAPVEKIILKNGGHGLEPVGGEMSPTSEEMFALVLAFLLQVMMKG